MEKFGIVRVRWALSRLVIWFFVFIQFGSAFADEKPQGVIIVGAGIAGLTTGYLLQKKGIPFKILETTPHVGGRVRTGHYPEGLSAEIGLEEIWANNPILNVIKELSVPIESSATAFSSVVLQGKLYPFLQETNRDFLATVLPLDEQASFQRWDHQMEVLYSSILRNPNGNELLGLKDISLAEWMRKESGLSETGLEFVRSQLEPEFATSWERIGALDGVEEWHIFSGEGLPSYHVVGGNEHLAEVIAAHLGEGTIETNAVVTNINSNSDGVEVTISDARDFQQRIYKGSYAVSTVPLYRLNDIQFSPPLDERRREAIDSQKGGSYFTAHVILDSAANHFWVQNGINILPILSDGPAGVIYGGKTEACSKQEILNLLVTGKNADRFNARYVSLDAVKEELTQALAKQWPGIEHMIQKMVFYRYHPHAIAAWPVGRSRFDELSNLMRQPFGNVYFAGDFTEGTHSTDAARSAFRVAEDIGKFLPHP